MLIRKQQDVEWLQFSNLSECADLIHGFTTRNGGVSHPPFSSLNMGRFTEDRSSDVQENYMRILSALEIETRPRYMTKQVHSDLVHHVDVVECTESMETFISSQDGLVTKRSDVALITYYADCVPIFLYDPVNHVGGVIHSGWKGTSKQIGKRAVERLSELFGSDPKNIIAGIGPCASGCCYEIDSSVVNAFSWMGNEIHNFLKPTTPEHYLIDLKGINQYILEDAGVKITNIEVSEYCTMCNNDLLFSYRIEKPQTGRMAAIFALKAKKIIE